jgi:ribosomal protein L29
MKKINEMSYEELSAYRREQNNSLGELYVKAANRELTEDEKMLERIDNARV